MFASEPILPEFDVPRPTVKLIAPAPAMPVFMRELAAWPPSTTTIVGVEPAVVPPAKRMMSEAGEVPVKLTPEDYMYENKFKTFKKHAKIPENQKC